MNLSAFIRTFSKFDTEVENAVRSASKVAGRKALTYAHWISDGRKSYRWLASKDHPYATRHGSILSVVGDQDRINRHDGKFWGAWKVEITSEGFRLTNDAFMAGWLADGTSKMLGRNLRGRIREHVWPIFETELRLALRRISK